MKLFSNLKLSTSQECKNGNSEKTALLGTIWAITLGINHREMELN